MASDAEETVRMMILSGLIETAGYVRYPIGAPEKIVDEIIRALSGDGVRWALKKWAEELGE